jgi:hypothetical protein
MFMLIVYIGGSSGWTEYKMLKGTVVFMLK